MKRIVLQWLIIICVSSIGLAILIVLAVHEHHAQEQAILKAQMLDSVLAIRSFRNDEAKVEGNNSISYSVSVNEDFKVAWIVRNMSEAGTLTYVGPAGIGTGVINIPVSQGDPSIDQFKEFKAAKPGTATFTLSTTGPGKDGLISNSTVIIITIK